MDSGRTEAACRSFSSEASIVRWPCSRISFSMNNEYKTTDRVIRIGRSGGKYCQDRRNCQRLPKLKISPLINTDDTDRKKTVKALKDRDGLVNNSAAISGPTRLPASFRRS